MKKACIVLSIVVCFGTLAFAQDVRLKILEQPKPELPQNYGTLDIQGNVVLRIEFLENGEIGEITQVKQLPAGLTERAVAAAKKIKFEPEKKDGKPVTVVKQIEYFEGWNGGWRTPANDPNVTPPPVAEPGKAEAIIARRALQLLGGDRYLQTVRRSAAANSASSAMVRSSIPDLSRRDRLPRQGTHRVQRQRFTHRPNQHRQHRLDLRRRSGVDQGSKTKARSQTSSKAFAPASTTCCVWRLEERGRTHLHGPPPVHPRQTQRRHSPHLQRRLPGRIRILRRRPPAKVHPQTPRRRRRRHQRRRPLRPIHRGRRDQSPFIVDRFTGGQPSSRINYESLEFNKPIPDTIFAKPANPKEAKKEIKL